MFLSSLNFPVCAHFLLYLHPTPVVGSFVCLLRAAQLTQPYALVSGWDANNVVELRTSWIILKAAQGVWPSDVHHSLVVSIIFPPQPLKLHNNITIFNK